MIYTIAKMKNKLYLTFFKRGLDVIFSRSVPSMKKNVLFIIVFQVLWQNKNMIKKIMYVNHNLDIKPLSLQGETY